MEENKRYEMLITTKEILTQEEYEFCKGINPKQTWRYLNDIGNGRWLNINVYSEKEHDDLQLRMEQGI